MRKNIFILLAFSITWSHGQEWQPVDGKMKTKWTDQVNPTNAWQSYPRPQLVRKDWKNLNGLWDYAIQLKGTNSPKNYQGKILVPFCIESSLSGVGKPLTPENELWYRTWFDIEDDWSKKDIILHFGAVDFKCTLYINGKKVGTHEGGNTPFSFNITKYLKKNKQELVLAVWDPTDTGMQPRGKQVLNPKGFWYTAVSGIWQTVWLEPTNKTHIECINPTSNIDLGQVTLNHKIKKLKGNESLLVTVKYKNDIVLTNNFQASQNITFEIDNAKHWSPNFPHLYTLEVQLQRGKKIIDKASSYFAMRKISLEKDSFGYTKLFLNNKELFHFGTLDQGWWPDGLLTPPSEVAMTYDMQVIKSLGFNTIRKHIKVEPAQYYYQADKMGLFLWQDMPSGFETTQSATQKIKATATEDWNRPENSARQFKAEWKSIIDNLKFFPSIVVWVPFNEGWGQFQSKEITTWTMAYDPSRLVNGISGWTDRGVGHFYDAHQYPGPGMEPTSQNEGRAVVVGEFGGLGFPVQNHLWDKNRNNWGYRTYKDKDEYLNQYTQAITNLYPEKSRGLAAAIYTQTTDVEAEVNGLLTYDREILKLPEYLNNVLLKPLYNQNKRALFLIEDGETDSISRLIATEKDGELWANCDNVDRGSFVKTALPFVLKKGSSVYSKEFFELDEIPENLALKFHGCGDVSIYINGVKIITKYLRTKRHYDDINLSTFTKFLRTGKNVLIIEVLNSTEDNSFDFGLYCY